MFANIRLSFTVRRVVLLLCHNEWCACYWFCKLGLTDPIPDHSTFSKNRPSHRCKLRLPMDTAFGSGPMLDWLVAKPAIAPHIPVIDKSGQKHGPLNALILPSILNMTCTFAPAVKSSHNIVVRLKRRGPAHTKMKRYAIVLENQTVTRVP
ncbi:MULTISPECIES: transposase [Falsihalocynthiibacter]|uniref:transposase n=1 Tax=Falsihalocynthiibacter TaxID=2854182 RepID=UPI00387EDE69